jgi:hypothetical protein
VSPFKNPFDTPTPSANTSFSNLFVDPTSGSKQAIANVQSEKDDFVGDGQDDQSMEAPESLDRPVSYVSAVFVGMAMCLMCVLLLGFATSNLIVEFLYDGNAMRLVLLVTIPLLALVGLFFLVTIFTDLFEMFGPIGSVQSNTRGFSAIKPSLNRAYQDGFKPPHITIQVSFPFTAVPLYIHSLISL